MGLTYYLRSDDAGAPAMVGSVGGAITVLDAVLKDGYNSKTVTITRSGTTATVNCTAHGFRSTFGGFIVKISGANESDYNGDFRATYVDANNFTFPVANSPSTPATGTITAKYAPIGWTKPYTGTNKAAYLQKAGTRGFYLRVDDNTNATNMIVRGYETMSDVDTGTGLYPTIAQIALASGPYIYKSNSAGASRSWQFLSNGKIFYLFVSQNAASGTDMNNLNGSMFAFGDIASYKTNDLYASILNADGSTGSNGNSSQTLTLNNYRSSQSGCYMARTAAGTGASINVCKASNGQLAFTNSNYVVGTSGINVYPDPVTGGLVMDRLQISETTSGVALRGNFPGVWNPYHGGVVFTGGDYFYGAAGTPMEGKMFVVFTGSWGQTAPVMLEVSDTWEV